LKKMPHKSGIAMGIETSAAKVCINWKRLSPGSA
jgi:hypothetical protein